MTSTSIGEQLKQARLDRKLSYKDVTRETKIQPWILEALEADRIHETTSPIYAKGFLSNYAKFLQLDAKALTQQWTARYLSPPSASETAIASSTHVPQPADTGSPSIAWNVSWPEIPWSWVQRIGITVASVAAIVVLVKVDPIQKVTARLHRQEASVTPIKKKASVPVQDATLRVAPTQPLELSIVAQKATFISIIADGHLITQQQLAAGAKERWTAQKHFEIVVAKPAHVDILLNGHSISPFAMAHQGRLKITHSSIKPLVAAAESSQ